MVRRLAIVVGLGGLALAAACVSLAGLSGGDASPAPLDAGADASPVEAAPPPDPCSHATYPGPPAKDDDPAGQVAPLVVAVREESLSRTIDGGASFGFDLDGVCTCFPDTTTAHGASPSCVAPEGGAAACDEDGGVDRQVNALLAAYTVPTRAGAAGPTLLMKVTKYNGRANDSEVFVGFVASAGIFDRKGCTSPNDEAGAPYPPTWRGCDKFALEESSLLPGTIEPTSYMPGYVTDHVLVVPPAAKPVVYVLGTTSLVVSGAVLVVRLTPVDAQLQPIDPTPEVGQLFHLEGTAAGRVSTSDALRAIAKEQAANDGGPLCGFGNFYSSVKHAFICPGADITTSPASDFKGLGCDALSLAASFVADPALFGDPRKPDSSGCGDPADPKYAPLFDCAQ